MITQTHLDTIADVASEAHRLFREKHWQYFHRSAPIGQPFPPSIPALDRESFRLFDIKNAASKAALDFEYIVKFGKR